MECGRGRGRKEGKRRERKRERERERERDYFVYPIQMTTHFNQSHAEPGEPISLTATATPGSIVLLSVYDKSLSLLAEACKSLEKDNVRIVHEKCSLIMVVLMHEWLLASDMTNIPELLTL